MPGKQQAVHTCMLQAFIIYQIHCMKKIISIFFILISTVTISKACELCGCGTGNLYIGQLPGFKTRFIGVRYQYMGYKTEMAADKSMFSKDSYQTTEIWSGWNIGKKWQVLVFVPWQYNRKVTDDGIKESNGLGDISLLINYQLLHTIHTNRNNQMVEQQLWVGTGIKTATGKYQLDLSAPDANIGDANSQNGTGATGLLLNGMYQLRIGNNGLGSTVNYMHNGTNASGYRFGDRFSMGGFVYHRYRFSGIGLSPNLGLLYNQSGTSRMEGNKVDNTGGHAVNLTAGIELNLNRISLGLNTQLPLEQNYAAGQTLLTNHTVLHLSVAF